MTVIVLERVSASLRGELTRWLLEPHVGVFVGRPSALVRERLWELVCDKVGTGAAVLVYSADTEQGFTMRTCGNTARHLRDFEGLTLVLR
jgi:CRISPR-associated protein Cas2